MNKLKIYLLSIAALMCTISAKAKFYEFEEGGLKYKTTKTEAWVIGYTEAMPEHVVIPKTISYDGQTFNVTTIGNKAFLDCTSLTSIDFGNINTIESGDYNGGSFSNCTSLTSIDLKNVVTIGDYAFEKCSSLSSIDLKVVETIGDYAFSNCTSLTSIDLKNLTTIGKSAFSLCTSLTSIDLKNVKYIEDFAFSSCDSLSSIDFRNVKKIDWNAFFCCSSLTSIDLKNVESVGRSAFERCTSLTSIDLKHVTDIDDEAFIGCENITEIRTSEINTPSIGKNTFENMVYPFSTLFVPIGSKENYTSHAVWSKFKNIEEFKADPKNCILSITASKGGSVSFNGVTASNNIQLIEVKKGEQVTINITPDKGYKMDYVKVNGVNVTSELKDNTYTAPMNNDLNVEVKFIELPIFLTIQYADNGVLKQTAERGKTYHFEIIASENWKINTVTFNDIDVTSQLDENNGLTTPAITESSTLNVSFESTNLAISNIMEDRIAVRAHNNQIYVEGISNGTSVSIYTNNGTRLASQISNGNNVVISVASGNVYIVKVGSRTFKIAM